MRASRLFLLIAVALVTLSHRSDGQQARPVAEQMRLSGVVPRGALVYVQASNLSQLMRMWLASPVRDQFYKSSSFTAFSESRIYLKFQNRRKDFESAIGFGLGEDRLAELAGGISAIAIYDIGNLEMVFVTEVGRAQAIATSLFKQAPQFQERSAGGSSYYARDVTTDNGNLKQQFCFAYQEGKLIVTTTEGLMVRALANARQAGEDSLQADVLSTVALARGFTPHEIVIWLDQAQLNKNLYFNNYWIHRNVEERAPSSLAKIENGIIDVRFTPQGLSEQRWFKLAGQSAQANALEAVQMTAMMRFAPSDAQLIEVRAPGQSDERFEEAAARILFGELKEGDWAPPVIPDRTRYMRTEGSGSRTERYRRLDSRFDRDVDDDHAPGRKATATRDSTSGTASSQESGFASKAASILAALSPVGYCEMARSRASAGTPFVTFERAIVVEAGSINALDRTAIEQAIAAELRARFVVSGIEPQIEWRDETGGGLQNVRYVAQSLLDRGAAYAVSGKYLVLASSREFARDILRAAAAPVAAQPVDGPAEFYALVRVTDAKPVFDTLMSKLDGKNVVTVAGSNDQEESGSDVKFFSDNLSSLIAASTIREVRIRRDRDGAVLVERLVYSW